MDDKKCQISAMRGLDGPMDVANHSALLSSQQYRIGILQNFRPGPNGGSFCANGRQFFCRISFINLNFFLPFSLSRVVQSKFNDACPIFACPLLPSPPLEFSNPSIFKKEKNSTHLLSKVARWQNLIPSFPWIALGWRARGAIQISQRSVA